MEITIFHNTNISQLQDDVNEFLDKHSNDIDVKQIAQSFAGDELVITVLFRVKDQF